jgi:hypothetical protein
MRDRIPTPKSADRERDAKRAPRGAKSKSATLARKRDRRVKYARQGR